MKLVWIYISRKENKIQALKKTKESRKSYINVIAVKERSCFFSGEE